MSKKILIKKKVSEDSSPKKVYANLEEVIDKTKVFNMLYSGVEDDKNFNILYDLGIRNFLMSYHYVQSKNLDTTNYESKGIKFLIDSGAFTYMSNPQYQEKTIEEWEKHIEKYLEWARVHKDIIFALASLDIEALVGGDKVQEWNEKYFEPFMLETGIPVCFVWHQEWTKLSWEQYCQRYPYVGLSWGTETYEDGTGGLKTGQKMLKIAEKYNTVVHGMAMTRTKLLTKLPFYTVDSSVDGKSSIVVKDVINGLISRLTIEEFFKMFDYKATKTTPSEDWIDMIGSKYRVLTVNANNHTVWGDLKAIVKHTVKKPTVKFKVEGGKELVCTNDHSIITMNKEGTLIETKADELKVGDYLLSPSKYNNEQRLTPFCDVIIQKPTYSKKRGELQVIELSDKYLEFLGLWVGDGCYFNNDLSTLGFSCYQDLECKEVIDLICNLYNTQAKVKSNGVDVRIHNVRMRRIMEALEFKGESHTKRIPSFIYSLSTPQINAFLRGYMSADGTGTCECSTVSEELKNDLVELFEMQGIYTSVSTREARKFKMNNKEYNAKKIWHISIKDIESKVLYKEKIGFLQAYKNIRLETEITKTNSRGARRTCIPKQLAITNTIKTSAKRSVSINQYSGRISRKYNNGFAPKVIQSSLNFLEIKDISIVNDGSQEVEVYDLSVKEYEKFIANGIVVHNTTWMVGVQYGEVNYWNNNKMSRLKKEKWKGEMLETLVRELGRDRQLLLNEDSSELIKINVQAFQKAEEYVQDKLKSKMYWLKPTISKQEINSIVFPSIEWLHGDKEDYANYVKTFNINPDLEDLDTVMDIITDITCFLNWDNPEYADLIEEMYTPELIKELHDLWVNRVVPDDETKIKDLQKFYTECVEGKNDKLLVYGSNFDRIAKERDSYIEEDLDDTIDVSDKELFETLGDFLPAPSEEGAIEIDSLDDEIFSDRGLVAVRDSKGKFLKGQKKVKKPKNVYSDKYPKLVCNTCYASQTCPEFKEGFVCAFNKMFKRFDCRNTEDILQAMQGMVNLNMERMQRQAIFEMLDGGIANGTLTGMIDQNMRLMMNMKSVMEHNQALMSQTRTIHQDGSVSETTKVNKPSILEGFFSNMRSSKDNVVDVDAEDIIETK